MWSDVHSGTYLNLKQNRCSPDPVHCSSLLYRYEPASKGQIMLNVDCCAINRYSNYLSLTMRTNCGKKHFYASHEGRRINYIIDNIRSMRASTDHRYYCKVKMRLHIVLFEPAMTSNHWRVATMAFCQKQATRKSEIAQACKRGFNQTIVWKCLLIVFCEFPQ